MSTKKKPHLLTIIVFFVLSALVAAGCSCDDNEYSAETACEKLVAAANGVLASCMLPTADDINVCGYAAANCASFAGCTPTADVDGCVNAIKAMSCTDVDTRAYANVASCIDVLGNISSSCSSSSNSGSSDFD